MLNNKLTRQTDRIRPGSLINNLADELDRSLRHEEATHDEYTHFPVDELFDEEPVPLRTFLRDRKFLFLPPLSEEQELAVEFGSQIYFPHTAKSWGWQYAEPIKHVIVLKWGKGSGKDTVARITFSRIAYLLTCLKDPQRYYNMMPGEHINMLNVAYSGSQANNIFFEPLVKLLERSPWFKSRIEPHDGYIIFGKGVHLFSGHSESDSLEGNNLIAGVCDEIAAFRTKQELERRQIRSARPLEHSAESIIKMIRSSATSRFPDVWKMFLISFTRYKGDPICQAYDELQNNPKAFVSHKATWEVNPTRKESDFADDFRSDPEWAAATYKCEPPDAVDSYFKRLTDELVEEVFPYRKPEECPVDDFNNVRPWFAGIPGVSYFGHIDMGWKRDRAAFSLVHRAGFYEHVTVTRDESGVEHRQKRRLPIIEHDLVTNWDARGGEVDFSKIRALVFDLHEKRHFHIAKITLDGYQGADTIQQFNHKGILSELLSVDANTEPYDTVKDVLYTGRLRSYRRHPVPAQDILVNELRHLVGIHGRKVDHQMGGSKDESDSLAGAVYNAVNSGTLSSSEEDAKVMDNHESIFGQLDAPVSITDWKGHGRGGFADDFNSDTSLPNADFTFGGF